MVNLLNRSQDIIQTSYETPSLEQFNALDFSFVRTEALYTKIFTGILSRCSGLDSANKALFYNNASALFTSKFGLIHYMVQAYISSRITYLKLEKKTINGRNFDYIESITHVPTDVEIVRDNIIMIDFKHKEGIVIRHLYNITGGVNSMLLNNIQVANTPILKVSNLRDRNSSKDRRELQLAINEVMANIGSMGRGMAIDSLDNIEFATLDTSTSYSTFDLITRQVSEITGIPEGYIGGENAALFGSAEADNNELIFGLQKYFWSMFKPVVDGLLGTDVELNHAVTTAKIEEDLEDVEQEDKTEITEEK